MNRQIGYICVVVLAVILVGLAIHTPATIWIGTALDSGMGVIIKAWKEVLLLALIPLGQWVVMRHQQLRARLLNDKLFWIIKGYMLLHLVMLLVYWQGWWPSIAGLMIDLRYIVAFIVVYVVVAAYPWARRYLLRAIMVGAMIIIGFATVQHALPHDALKYIGYGPDTVVPYLTVDQNYDYIRLSSTMRGPNPMGAYAASVVLVLLALVAMKQIRSQRARVGAAVLIVASLTALWYSYSRSAKLALIAGIVVLIAVLQPWRHISRRMAASVGVLALSAGVAMLGVLWQTAWFSNVVLHSNPDGGSITQSNSEHWNSLIDGTERMVSQPLGAGVGSTGSASLFGDNPLIIENQYLFIAHEVGWLGLGLFVAIFGTILWRLYLRARDDPLAAGVLAGGIGLVVIGLVLPVWVDDVVSVVWWSLAAIVLASAVDINKRSSVKDSAKSLRKTVRRKAKVY